MFSVNSVPSPDRIAKTFTFKAANDPGEYFLTLSVNENGVKKYVGIALTAAEFRQLRILSEASFPPFFCCPSQ